MREDLVRKLSRTFIVYISPALYSLKTKLIASGTDTEWTHEGFDSYVTKSRRKEMILKGLMEASKKEIKAALGRSMPRLTQLYENQPV